jgi:alpha,alpha-trehalase
MPEQRQDPLPERLSGYADIRDYALIGDRYGSALVCRDGSIDWCCMPRFDSDPVFARILDQRRGGYFLIQPSAAVTVSRAYLPGTNVLETRFKVGDSICILTDFMATARDPDLHVLVRMVDVEGGDAEIYACIAPGCLADSHMNRLGDKLVSSDFTLWDGGVLEKSSDMAESRWLQKSGESRVFIFTNDGDSARQILSQTKDGFEGLARRFKNDTVKFWETWAARIEYQGPHRREVERSALTLKMMIYEPTGAMIAAPTSSLPEEIGGVRNWDYRFCWPRDAAFAFYALKKLGMKEDAERFFGFYQSLSGARRPPIPPLYAIDGSTENEERVIESFEGYKGSGPVHIGNEAAEQHQLDVYGQIIDLIYLHDRLGGQTQGDLIEIVIVFADFLAKRWRDEDAGLWEPRLPERRHVHSAIMSWTALDRAIQLVGERPEWVKARDEIVKDVSENAMHREGGHLTQTFGGEAADAAVLIAPVVGMPLDRDLLNRTVDAVIEELGAGPLVYRYRNDDGLPGKEGTFLVCAFWLVDALLILGREGEARQRFEELLALSNDVGLYSEQMGEDGTFLGNFPQAFTHLGVLQSALMIELYERGGVEALKGSYADRAMALGFGS